MSETRRFLSGRMHKDVSTGARLLAMALALALVFPATVAVSYIISRGHGELRGAHRLDPKGQRLRWWPVRRRLREPRQDLRDCPRWVAVEASSSGSIGSVFIQEPHHLGRSSALAPALGVGQLLATKVMNAPRWLLPSSPNLILR